MTLKGPLVSDSGGTFDIGLRFLRVAEGSSLTSTSTDSLFRLSGSTATIGGDFVRVSDFGQLISGGSLLRVADGSVVNTTDGAFINASSGGLVLIPEAGVEFGAGINAVNINNTIAPTTTINGVPVSITNNGFVSIGPNSGLDNLTVATGGSAIVASGAGTLVSIDPLLLPSGPFLTVNSDLPLGAANLANFNIGVTPTAEPIAAQTNTSVTVTAADAPEPGLQGQGIAQLNGPVINISNSTVTSTTDFVELSGTSLAIPGPLLDITNSTLDNTPFTGVPTLLSVISGSILKTFGTAPLIQIDSSTRDIGGDETFLFDGTVSLGGPLLTATGSTMTSLSNFAKFNGTLTSTTTQPLIQLTNSSLDFISVADFFISIDGTMNLSGPLLNATNSSNLSDWDEFIVIDGNLTSTSTSPLVSLSSGTTISSADDFIALSGDMNLSGPLLNAIGFTTDPVTGLGTDQPLKTGGRLFVAAAGATVNVGTTTTGNALTLDTALLEASAPIISLIGTTTPPDTTLTTGGATIDLIKSKVTSLGPVVALDKGLINVQSGPLINLTSGSSLAVTGDLLSLINGSQINVVNGPLIRVDGVAPIGTSPAVSTLSVSGALVNFGGTGGNQIIVNNSIAPTATLSGLPVSATTGGSIAIGPNPVKNPSLGNISVTGSLIEASNNGVVNITAPAP